MLLVILVFFSLISTLIVILVVACKRCNNRLKNMIETIKNKLFFSIFIRFSLQSYLDLNISTMLMLAGHNSESEGKLTIYIVITLLLAFLPFAYLKLLRRKLKSLWNHDVEV